MNTSIIGFNKNDITNLPKKNLAIKAFLSRRFIEGNFFVINSDIILQINFIG